MLESLLHVLVTAISPVVVGRLSAVACQLQDSPHVTDVQIVSADAAESAISLLLSLEGQGYSPHHACGCPPLPQASELFKLSGSWDG